MLSAIFFLEMKILCHGRNIATMSDEKRDCRGDVANSVLELDRWLSVGRTAPRAETVRSALKE